MLIILGPAITEGEPAMNQQASGLTSDLVVLAKGEMQAALPAASNREGADKQWPLGKRGSHLCSCWYPRG